MEGKEISDHICAPCMCENYHGMKIIKVSETSSLKGVNAGRAGM